MGERVEDSITIAAPLEVVWNTITDLPAYPQWAEGVTAIEVLEEHEDGSPHQATFHVDAKVSQITYTIEYAYDGDDISWHLVEGETLSQLDGRYTLTADGDGTAVHYSLEIDLDLPLPGFMKKRAARTILDQGLRGLKAQAEEQV
ncbi:MAG: SRPBCC family protein [Nitriliruptoraceae bacterium]